MRTLMLFFFFTLISCSSTEKISGFYQHYYNDDGFYDKITIELKQNGEFNYREFNEQICYETTRISRGNWKEENGVIELIASDNIKPKIDYRINPKLKDTLVIRVLDKNGNSFSDWFRFYGENKGWIYPNSISSTLKIPLEKRVKKIVFQDKLVVEVKENYNEILITNASKNIIYDFSTFKLLKKRNRLISTEKISGPTGKNVKGIFKKIK